LIRRRVLFLHFVQNVAHVEVAESADDGLVAAVIDPEARVLRPELMQDFGEALFIAAPFELERKRVHRYPDIASA
jgi:hypothetical protein